MTDLGEEYTAEEMEQANAEGLAVVDAGDTVDGEEAFRQLRVYSAERRWRRQ